MTLPALLDHGAEAEPVQPGPESEPALVARARTDPEAFAVLYRRRYSAIASYRRRRVGRRESADDLIAETFMAALEQLPKYQERGLPFRAWLYRLATSRANRWARRQRLWRWTPFAQEPADQPAACGADPAAAARARAALLSLPAHEQATLVLHYLEGLSVGDIAVTLDCAPGTVKARLARGRARLRRQLTAFWPELRP